MRSSRWYVLAVLTLVSTVNWADRQVVPILFPGIRAELGLSDTELGVIGGVAFSLIYAISGLGFGYAADRFLRKRILILGLVLWSAATAAGGLADGFWTLFAARFFTGLGEASLYPCAMSMIGERFEAHERGRALGLFGASVALGSGFGVGLGGLLAESIGWRQVFFLYGALGVALVPVLASIPERRRPPPRGGSLAVASALRTLLGERRLRWIWATGTLAIACGIGFGAWAPSYFERELGFSVSQAGLIFGAGGLLGGIVGGIAGGVVSDRRGRERAGGEIDVALVASLVSVALLAVMLASGASLLAALSGLLATLAIYSLFPGLAAAVLKIAPTRLHGTAGAINTIFLGGVGSAAGPSIVGVLSDGLGSLQAALLVPTLGLAVVAALAAHARVLMRRALPARGAGVLPPN